MFFLEMACLKNWSRCTFVLIKSALGVGKSTASDLFLIEAGLLNSKAVIKSRQYNSTNSAFPT